MVYLNPGKKIFLLLLSTTTFHETPSSMALYLTSLYKHRTNKESFPMSVPEHETRKIYWREVQEQAEESDTAELEELPVSILSRSQHLQR